MLSLRLSKRQSLSTTIVFFQNYTNPDDRTQQTTDTPRFKPFTIVKQVKKAQVSYSFSIATFVYFTLSFISWSSLISKSVGRRGEGGGGRGEGGGGRGEG